MCISKIRHMKKQMKMPLNEKRNNTALNTQKLPVYLTIKWQNWVKFMLQ